MNIQDLNSHPVNSMMETVLGFNRPDGNCPSSELPLVGIFWVGIVRRGRSLCPVVMGAGRTGQGGALAPPWNFKIIIIIAYKCNMYYL